MSFPPPSGKNFKAVYTSSQSSVKYIQFGLRLEISNTLTDKEELSPKNSDQLPKFLTCEHLLLLKSTSRT